MSAISCVCYPSRDVPIMECRIPCRVAWPVYSYRLQRDPVCWSCAVINTASTVTFSAQNASSHNNRVWTPLERFTLNLCEQLKPQVARLRRDEWPKIPYLFAPASLSLGLLFPWDSWWLLNCQSWPFYFSIWALTRPCHLSIFDILLLQSRKLISSPPQ